MNNNKKLLTIRIFSILLFIVLITCGYVIMYIYKKPSKIEPNNTNYQPINQSEYKVNEDELNQGLFEKLEFTFNNEEVQRFEDLKDYYSGRDNPFQTLDESNRNNIVNTEDIQDYDNEQQDNYDEEETNEDEEDYDIVY